MNGGFERFRLALMRLASDRQFAGCPDFVARDDDHVPRIGRGGLTIHQVESAHLFPYSLSSASVTASEKISDRTSSMVFPASRCATIVAIVA